MRTSKARTGRRARLACNWRRRVYGNLCRHTPEAGAVCGKAARTDLCGGHAMKRTSLPLQRREFITLLGCAAACPLAARAQQAERMRRIGVLNPFAENDPEVQAQITAFRQALQKLGWTERNLRIDYRWSEANPERLRDHAAELVALEPDVILVSSPLALQPLQQETRSIPIVFTAVSDPAGSGFVASLAHPGRNITGFAVAEFSM